MLGIATDKLLHIGICFLVNFMISTAMPSQTINGVGFSVGISIGKEVEDYLNPYSSGYAGDLLADGIGISLGVGCGLYVNDLLFDGKDIFDL